MSTDLSKYTDRPLEDLIRAAHKSGGINHISLAVNSDDKSWAVLFRDAVSPAPFRQVTLKDPVDALKVALASCLAVQNVLDGARAPAARKRRVNDDLI